jgi:hypothetical protein
MMISPNGVLFLSCASTGGTNIVQIDTNRESYGTIGDLEDMLEHYKN